MSLENMPPDVLDLMMLDVDELEDLCSLIGASPRCYQVFRQVRVRILSRVLKNSIHPDVLRHALAAHHCHDYLNDRPSDESSAAFATTLGFMWHVLVADLRLDHGIGPLSAESSAAFLQTKLYLDRYFAFDDANPSSLQFPNDEAELFKLCRLYMRVSHFVDDYSSRAMRALAPGIETEAAVGSTRKITLPLTPAERARFQRAFFRYDLFFRAFVRRPNEEPPRLFAHWEQVTQFMDRILRWEAEEMRCVHHYFATRIEDLLDDVHDGYAKEALLSARRPTAPLFLPPWALLLPQGVKPSYVQTPERFKGPDYNNLRFRISELASVDLSFMHRLIFATAEQREEILRNYSDHDGDRRWPSIPGALVDHPFYPFGRHLAAFRRPRRILADPANISHPNLGWHMLQDMARDRGVISDRVWCLREYGYVFWDAARIGVPEVSCKLRDPPTTLNGCEVYDDWLTLREVAWVY